LAPLSETLEKVVAKHIPVFLEEHAPGPGEGHGNRLKSMGAKFGNPAIFVSLVEWADRIIVE
jgi:hypothetical protein